MLLGSNPRGRLPAFQPKMTLLFVRHYHSGGCACGRKRKRKAKHGFPFFFSLLLAAAMAPRTGE